MNANSISTIINAKIHTMSSDTIESGFIFIQNGQIINVGHMSDYNEIKGSQIFDIAGKSVYPGFIDAHTHLGLFEDGLDFEGSDGNEDTDPITPSLRTIDAINPFDTCFKEALSAGITTVLSSPGSSNPIAGQICAIKTYGTRIDDMIINQNIGTKFSLGENPKSTYHNKDKPPITRMATASLIRQTLIKAKKYCNDKNKFLQDPCSFDEPEYDFDCESLIPLLQKKSQAYFHAHRSDDIFTAIRIAKEFDLNYVLVHATEGHLIHQNLQSEGALVLSGPFLCDRSKPELSHLTPKSPGVMSMHGIKTAIISDHPVIPLQYLTLCAALAVREGMNHDEALRGITINAAEICKINDKVGSIEIGKDADLVIFDKDPLDFCAKPIMVFARGSLIL